MQSHLGILREPTNHLVNQHSEEPEKVLLDPRSHSNLSFRVIVLVLQGLPDILLKHLNLFKFAESFFAGYSLLNR